MKKSLTAFRGFAAILAAAVAACALSILLGLAIERAYALDEPAYSPGEDYFIDEPDAFLDQDPGYSGATESEGSTTYWMTCPFYLEWVSNDVVIYEGETAYIGCRATGLDDLAYEWYLSADGGQWFEKTDLVGSEHTLSGLKVNDPQDTPYIYKCLITNGDGLSTLVATVNVTVLSGGGTHFPQTGDAMLYIAGALAALALIALACMYLSRKKTARATKLEDRKEDTSYK